MKANPYRSLCALCVAVPLLLGTGCKKSEPEETIPPEAKKEAEEIFAGRCTPCHGAEGRGDGPASAGLTPKPRNFGDRPWQKSVSNEHIENIVQYGGAAVGKSPAMPPNPDLVAKPAVIKALRAHIRSLGK